MRNQKTKLTYRNLELDIERCCEKTNEMQMGIPVLRGYDQARREVFDAYIEKKLFRQVVDYLLTQNWEWGTNNFFEGANQSLQAEEDITNLSRLWKGVIASQEGNYWTTMAVSNPSRNTLRALNKAKEITLAHMLRYREILLKQDDRIEIEKIDIRISQIKDGKRSRKSKPILQKEMDINQFWDLIENSRQTSSSIPEQIEMMDAELENLEPKEIILFQELLEDKLCEAYTWDLWALAYIAQDGCSDDGFEYFRAWIILQGRELFTNALEDIHLVLDEIPPGLETHAESLLSLARIAYQSQTGEILPEAKPTTCPLKGSAWEEDELRTLYPRVCNHYEFE
jgi:hypothetical protein